MPYVNAGEDSARGRDWSIHKGHQVVELAYDMQRFCAAQGGVAGLITAAATQTQQQVQCRLLPNAVVGGGAIILQLLAVEELYENCNESVSRRPVCSSRAAPNVSGKMYYSGSHRTALWGSR